MRVLVAGDYCPQNRVQKLFNKDDYSAVFSDVESIIKTADYSILNFECPIACNQDKPIVKLGPNLHCNENSVNALRWVGFKAVTLANNHFRDFGNAGVERTINALQKAGIDYVGGGSLNDSSRILYFRHNGDTVAFINCCEHEYSIVTPQLLGSNPLNPIQQYYNIKEAKDKANWVIVVVHGGNEHYKYPTPRMKETYRFFVDAGADAVINHHQHCYSGYELYNGKPIFYGLGNFCFDFPDINNETWAKGYMVELLLDGSISFNIIPYRQCEKEARVSLLDEGETKAFNADLEMINSIINDDDALNANYKRYLSSFDDSIDLLLQPYSRMTTIMLYKKHLLPSLLSKRKLLHLLSYLQCESHYPKLIHFLNSRLNIEK